MIKEISDKKLQADNKIENETTKSSNSVKKSSINPKQGYEKSNKTGYQTMNQFLQVYFKNKHNLKQPIQEHSQIFFNSVEKYKSDSHDVLLFDKILKNTCEEDFRQVQCHVRDQITSIDKTLIKEKYPTKQGRVLN